MKNTTLKCEVSNVWQQYDRISEKMSTRFNFWWIELNKRPSEITYPKGILSIDALFDKLTPRY